MEKPCDPTQVHTQESTGRLSTHQSYRTYRRSFVAEEFTAAESMYSRLDDRDELRRIQLLDGCRRQAWFVRNVKTGHVHVASNACRLRWCPICSRAKSAFITNAVRPWIEQLQTARFLTLTLKHSNAPLRTQIDKLYADFRLLRRDTQFKELCSGGIWFFQIKLSEKSQSWHPHIHCILSGSYIAHEWISRKWLSITKSSRVVDIRMVRDPDKAASEVARYSATPAQLRLLDTEQRIEVFDSMHRRRMCGTWGKAKGVSLSQPRKVDRTKYEDLGSYYVVIGNAEFDNTAKQIYRAWMNKTPLMSGVKMTGVDAWLDGRIEDLKAEVAKGKFEPQLDFQ